MHRRRMIFIGTLAGIIGLIVTLLNLFTGKLFLRGEREGIYLLQAYLPFIITALIGIPPLLFFIVADIPGFIFEKVGCIHGIVVGVVLAILAIVILTFLGPALFTFDHLDSLQIAGATYHAAWVSSYQEAPPDCVSTTGSGWDCQGTFINEYIVFRCRFWEIGCWAIAHIPTDATGILYPLQVQLVPGDNAQQITLIVNGSQTHQIDIEK